MQEEIAQAWHNKHPDKLQLWQIAHFKYSNTQPPAVDRHPPYHTQSYSCTQTPTSMRCHSQYEACDMRQQMFFICA